MEDGSRVLTHEIVVPRTARYVVLGAGVSRVEEVWLVCHGYGQLASRFIRRFGVLDNGKRLIVAPEALSRFYVSGGSGPHSADDKVGASWITREGRDSEISDQVTYLDLVVARVLAGLAGSDIGLVGFGFSQGTAAVCRWAARTETPPKHLVLWGSGVPAELLEGEAKERLSRATLTIVAGEQDPIADPGRVASHRQQLNAASLVYRYVSHEGGHDVDAAVLAEIATGFSAGTGT